MSRCLGVYVANKSVSKLSKLANQLTQLANHLSQLANQFVRGAVPISSKGRAKVLEVYRRQPWTRRMD
mgnify:CR=1 FL=1